jgi:mono/diheme cytochrome c family protein
LLFVACVASLLAGGAATRAQVAVTTPKVDCDGAGGAVCRVDLATYIGWRVFHAQCATCHARDALGSSFAPDLVERIRGMDQRAFVRALDDGYMGPDDPAPPRGANPDVARYYNELWSYLRARASGELPPGPLEPLRAEGTTQP